MLNVGKRTVEYARIVRQHGDEALIAAVENGEVSDAAKPARFRVRLAISFTAEASSVGSYELRGTGRP
jgi:hypothetical protein